MIHPVVQALIEHEYAAQRSEEWLALRGKMLTASDAATAIGVNVYEKPDGLILKKCGLNKFSGNEAQIHGGGHERGMRSGTLAVHQIVGMGEAFRIARIEMAERGN